MIKLGGFKYGLIVCSLFLGVILASIALTDYLNIYQFSFQFSLNHYFIFALLAIIYLFFSVVGTVFVSSLFLINAMSIRSAFEQAGVGLVGKYVPGKVWGVVIRVYMADLYSASKSSFFKISVYEQLIVVYLASSIGIILRFTPNETKFFILSLFALVLIVVLFWPLVYQKITSSLKLFTFLEGRFPALSKLSENESSRLSYPKCLMTLVPYIFSWCVIALVIHQTLSSFNNGYTDFPITVKCLGAYMVAVTLGFMAFFAPGGVGVREGVLVGLMSTEIGIRQATELALLLRVWSVAIDVLSGFILLASITLRHRPQREG